MCETELRANSLNKLSCLGIQTRRANCFVCEFILEEATGSQILMLNLERLSVMVHRENSQEGRQLHFEVNHLKPRLFL